MSLPGLTIIFATYAASARIRPTLSYVSTNDFRPCLARQ